LGCVMITPVFLSRGSCEDIAHLTIQARAARVRTLACRGSHAGVVELVDTPALGAGGR
jgi:hypothetical protein